MKVWLDKCPYCGPGPCRGSARTANGRDVEHFHAVHPRQRETRDVPAPDASDWPRTPYCDGQRAAITGRARWADSEWQSDGPTIGEWYAGFDDALIGKFYGATS